MIGGGKSVFGQTYGYQSTHHDNSFMNNTLQDPSSNVVMYRSKNTNSRINENSKSVNPESINFSRGQQEDDSLEIIRIDVDEIKKSTHSP